MGRYRIAVVRFVVLVRNDDTDGRGSAREGTVVFITALTRKLLVALWWYATSGLVPEGAKLARSDGEGFEPPRGSSTARRLRAAPAGA